MTKRFCDICEEELEQISNISVSITSMDREVHAYLLTYRDEGREADVCEDCKYQLLKKLMEKYNEE